MVQKITLEEILSIKYVKGYEWSPDGKWIAYRWNDGGITDCWLVNVERRQKAQKLTEAQSAVTGMSWSSQGNLALVNDGDIWLAEPNEDWFYLRRLTTSGCFRPSVKWSPDGSLLAFSTGSRLCFYCYETGLIKDVKVSGEVFAGAFSQTISRFAFHWSPEGSKFFYTYLDSNKKPYLAICDQQGRSWWQSPYSQAMIENAKWIDDNRVVYRLRKSMGSVFDYYILTLPAETERHDYSDIGVTSQVIPDIKHILHAEQKERKGTFYCDVFPNSSSNTLLFGLENDGWFHYYLYDMRVGSIEQLTKGNCEDFGQAGDIPTWSPDGKKFVYASNRSHRLHRQLWLYDIEQKTNAMITNYPVTNLMPKWSPDGKNIAFLHCDSHKSSDLWLLNAETMKDPRQLTFSMPAGLEEKIQPPEVVTYKSALDWEIDAFLFKPRDFDPSKKYPGIVWVHGGPMRQMRGSWHPSQTYAHFYAFNQYLTDHGYIVLSTNFRGGIGYGSAFRYGLYHKKGIDDTKDVVNAGRYLQNLPYVDENTVAVYGLSYGGYMTLHCLTQYPHQFVMGINIAGLWDQAQWARWIRETYGNYEGDINFGGMPEDRPDLWANGSPVTYKSNLCRPIINFQGTKDPNVDFAQLDRIVADCVKMGATYEAYYYPGESHTFRYRETWQDAFPKMLREFDKYLK